MRQRQENDKLSLINRNNLRSKNYTQSLVREALRVHFISMSVVDDLQMQIMGQLEELIREEEAQGRRTDDADADRILNGVFFSLDTCLLAYHDPMYALAQLQTGSVSEMYRVGQKLLKSHLFETVSLWVQARRSMPENVPESYAQSIGDQVRAALKAWDPLRCPAQSVPFSYSPADPGWQQRAGLFSVKYYLRFLLSENHLYRRFATLTELPAAKDENKNLFQCAADPILARAALGRYASAAPLNEEEIHHMRCRLTRRRPDETVTLLTQAAQSLLHDLALASSERTAERRDAAYLLRYAQILGRQLAQNPQMPEAVLPV